MNKSENIIKYREFGDVKYVYNKRARNLSIRINQQGEIRMTIPRYVSQKKAEAFLMTKKGWIIKKLSEINQLADSGQKLQEGDVIYVRGKAITIVLQKDHQGL